MSNRNKAIRWLVFAGIVGACLGAAAMLLMAALVQDMDGFSLDNYSAPYHPPFWLQDYQTAGLIGAAIGGSVAGMVTAFALAVVFVAEADPKRYGWPLVAMKMVVGVIL